MSKIGRKPIDIKNLQVEVKGQDVHYKGKKLSGVHQLPDGLTVEVAGNELVVLPHGGVANASRHVKREWGLHRALLANKIKGADAPFEKEVIINGLGYKAVLSGQKIAFSLGFSHKIDFELPKEVALEVDKTGQKLVFKSTDKELLGHICSRVKELRPPEPYKGTGVKLATDVIVRKAGKTKAA